MINSLAVSIKRVVSFIGGWIAPYVIIAQNLVPNPGFEDTSACMFSFPPQIDCLNNWNFSYLNNPNFNTPDLCFNGAVFFPPSSIPAYDGTKYIGVDCQPMNSEYVQTPLLQPLQAGKSYCVSFYVSVCDQTMNPAVSLGAYFSNGMLTDNPYVNGIAAHVQGNVPQDPTLWTKISGVYVAAGGEDHITLGGFQNTGSPGFVYMYIDLVEVYEIPDQNNFTSLEICPDEFLLLTAPATATSYLWNTSEITNSISVTQAGLFTVEKTYGSCILTDTFLITNGSCLVDSNNTDTVEIIEEPQTLFIPSAFTPNGDGMNDTWMVYGENVNELSVKIFNRWGEIIFVSSDFNFAWDGKNKNKEVQIDVYVYEVIFVNQFGIRENRKGKVVILL